MHNRANIKEIEKIKGFKRSKNFLAFVYQECWLLIIVIRRWFLSISVHHNLNLKLRGSKCFIYTYCSQNWGLDNIILKDLPYCYNNIQVVDWPRYDARSVLSSIWSVVTNLYLVLLFPLRSFINNAVYFIFHRHHFWKHYSSTYCKFQGR